MTVFHVSFFMVFFHLRVMLNVKSGLQIRIFTRKSLDDWKILLNFAALNIKKVKINNKTDI